MQSAANDNDVSPRLLTKKAAAAYVGVSAPTFAKWVLAGIMPAPVSITRMWDKKAIDGQLDKISGLETSNVDNGYELRKRERDAKKSARSR